MLSTEWHTYATIPDPELEGIPVVPVLVKTVTRGMLPARDTYTNEQRLDFEAYSDR